MTKKKELAAAMDAAQGAATPPVTVAWAEEFVTDSIKGYLEGAAYFHGRHSRAKRGTRRSLYGRWDSLSPNQQEMVYTYLVSTGHPIIFLSSDRSTVFVEFIAAVAYRGQ